MPGDRSEGLGRSELSTRCRQPPCAAGRHRGRARSGDGNLHTDYFLCPLISKEEETKISFLGYAVARELTSIPGKATWTQRHLAGILSPFNQAGLWLGHSSRSGNFLSAGKGRAPALQAAASRAAQPPAQHMALIICLFSRPVGVCCTTTDKLPARALLHCELRVAWRVALTKQ